MEIEILERLSRIENILLAQSLIFAVLILGLVAMFVQSWMVRRAQIGAALKQAFLNEAVLLEDQGKNEELLKLARTRLDNYASDITAKWYSALALYRLERYGEALSEFSDLQKNEPAWERETVAEYIAAIRAKLHGPKRT